MRKLYDAANSVQAQILADLLKQEGIQTEIQGGQLHGAAGELPVLGVVRLMVSEQDYSAARATIDQWESTEIEATIGPKKIKKQNSFVGFFVGLLLGVATMFFAFKAPTGNDGTDFNRDGTNDERWILSPTGRALKYELDRNLDGKIDFIMEYDSRGLAESGKSDDDFNGIFETTFSIRNTNFTNTKVDTDGDQFADLDIQYENGVIVTVEYLSPTNGLPLRVEHFKLGKLIFVDIDTNRDGKLDTRKIYSPLAEVVSTEPVPVKN